jgi:hypothetical protein
MSGPLPARLLPRGDLDLEESKPSVPAQGILSQNRSRATRSRAWCGVRRRALCQELRVRDSPGGYALLATGVRRLAAGDLQRARLLPRQASSCRHRRRTPALHAGLNRLLSLDSTTISLCLSLFPWADFRQAKGGVKLHVLLNHDDYLPGVLGLRGQAKTSASGPPPRPGPARRGPAPRRAACSGWRAAGAPSPLRDRSA